MFVFHLHLTMELINYFTNLRFMKMDPTLQPLTPLISFIEFAFCIMVNQGHFHSHISNTSILIFMVIVRALNNNGLLI